MLPAIEISPAGAGTATQQQAFTWNGAGDDDWHSFSSSSESYLLFLSASRTYQIDAYRLTAQAASGYTFRRFEITYDNDEEGSPVSGGNVYTSSYLDTVKAEKEREGHPGIVFTRLIGDYSETSGSYSYSYHVTGIKAVFDQGTPPVTTYTISAYSSPQNGGTVQVGNAESGATSSQTVEVGGSVNIVATASSGYAFNGWYLGNTLISSSATYAVSNVTAAQTFEARFREVCHIVVMAFKSECRVSLNGVPGDDTPSARTVVEADIDKNSTFTISATPLRPSLNPFKTWYLNPTAPFTPESGTPISNEPTITLTATDSATYFATVRKSYTISVRAEDTAHNAAPSAVLSINSQTSGNNTYTLEVAEASTVVVGATDYGGDIDEGVWGDKYRLYFKGWKDAFDQYETIISTSLQYSFTASREYELIAVYERYFKLLTAILPNDSYGSIETNPQPTHVGYYPYSLGSIILTANPKGTRFVKWTMVDRYGRETQVSTSPTITISRSLDYYYWRECTYKAYFNRTHLLVNSYNKSTPIQLVYDESSGLLVADY